MERFALPHHVVGFLFIHLDNVARSNIDELLQLFLRQPSSGWTVLRKSRQNQIDVVLVGKGCLPEVFLDLTVFTARHENTEGVASRSTSSTDHLVVGHHRSRRLQRFTRSWNYSTLTLQLIILGTMTLNCQHSITVILDLGAYDM